MYMYFIYNPDFNGRPNGKNNPNPNPNPNGNRGPNGNREPNVTARPNPNPYGSRKPKGIRELNIAARPNHNSKCNANCFSNPSYEIIDGDFGRGMELWIGSSAADGIYKCWG